MLWQLLTVIQSEFVIRYIYFPLLAFLQKEIMQSSCSHYWYSPATFRTKGLHAAFSSRVGFFQFSLAFCLSEKKKEYYLICYLLLMTFIWCVFVYRCVLAKTSLYDTYPNTCVTIQLYHDTTHVYNIGNAPTYQGSSKPYYKMYRNRSCIWFGWCTQTI